MFLFYYLHIFFFFSKRTSNSKKKKKQHAAMPAKLKIFLLILLLVVTYVISDVHTAPARSRLRRATVVQRCGNKCDGNYMMCSYVIRSVFEHYICLKVRSGCKNKCKNPEKKDVESDVVIAPLSPELASLWNVKS